MYPHSLSPQSHVLPLSVEWPGTKVRFTLLKFEHISRTMLQGSIMYIHNQRKILPHYTKCNTVLWFKINEYYPLGCCRTPTHTCTLQMDSVHTDTQDVHVHCAVHVHVHAYALQL